MSPLGWTIELTAVRTPDHTPVSACGWEISLRGGMSKRGGVWHGPEGRRRWSYKTWAGSASQTSDFGEKQYKTHRFPSNSEHFAADSGPDSWAPLSDFGPCFSPTPPPVRPYIQRSPRAYALTHPLSPIRKAPARMLTNESSSSDFLCAISEV